MSYSDKFKDPRWQRKRLEIMQRDKFECVHCGRDEKSLNVHHLYYVAGRDPWDYPTFALQTVCDDCHKEQHEPVPNGWFGEWEEAMQFLVGTDPALIGELWNLGSEFAQRDSLHPIQKFDILRAAISAREVWKREG